MNKYKKFAALLWVVSMASEAKEVDSKTPVWSKSCIPSQFKNENPFSVSLAEVAEASNDLFPSIKAEQIRQEIPSYELFHIDDVFNKKVPHDIQVYISKEVDHEKFSEERSKLWNIHELAYPVFIEKETDTPFWRVYIANEKKPFWYLVRTQPLKPAPKLIPKNWYIGHCSEDLCAISVENEKYTHSYSIVRSEMSKFDKISSFIDMSVASIVESCSK